MRSADGGDEAVLLQMDGSVATLTLNRPEKLNALTTTMLELLASRLKAVASLGNLRVVVLTGAGRAFCAGGDLGSRPTANDLAQPIDQAVARQRKLTVIAEQLHEMDAVTIAAVNGPCAGAGLALATACDLRYASRDASFRSAFLNAGLSGDFGGSWTLTRIVGTALARELYLRPVGVGADRAFAMGLVNELFDGDALMTEVRAIAGQIAGSPPLALASIKANLNDALHLGLSDLLDIESRRNSKLHRTADAAEAAAAFIERRSPVFRGR